MPNDPKRSPKRGSRKPSSGRKPSGWDAVAKWYDGWVGKGGSHHHRKLRSLHWLISLIHSVARKSSMSAVDRAYWPLTSPNAAQITPESMSAPACWIPPASITVSMAVSWKPMPPVYIRTASSRRRDSTALPFC